MKHGCLFYAALFLSVIAVLLLMASLWLGFAPVPAGSKATQQIEGTGFLIQQSAGQNAEIISPDGAMVFSAYHIGAAKTVGDYIVFDYTAYTSSRHLLDCTAYMRTDDYRVKTIDTNSQIAAVIDSSRVVISKVPLFLVNKEHPERYLFAYADRGTAFAAAGKDVLTCVTLPDLHKTEYVTDGHGKLSETGYTDLQGNLHTWEVLFGE